MFLHSCKDDTGIQKPRVPWLQKWVVQKLGLHRWENWDSRCLHNVSMLTNDVYFLRLVYPGNRHSGRECRHQFWLSQKFRDLPTSHWKIRWGLLCLEILSQNVTFLQRTFINKWTPWLFLRTFWSPGSGYQPDYVRGPLQPEEHWGTSCYWN